MHRPPKPPPPKTRKRQAPKDGDDAGAGGPFAELQAAAHDAAPDWTQVLAAELGSVGIVAEAAGLAPIEVASGFSGFHAIYEF